MPHPRWRSFRNERGQYRSTAEGREEVRGPGFRQAEVASQGWAKHKHRVSGDRNCGHNDQELLELLIPNDDAEPVHDLRLAVLMQLLTWPGLGECCGKYQE